jgi:uncharacterized membrane protein
MMLLQILGIFGTAFFSLWAAVLAGIALQLNPVIVVLTTWISYSLGAILVVLLGKPIRERLLKRFGGKMNSNPDSTIRRAWNRYGLIGLALLAPITTGAQIGALLGLSFGAPPRRLILGISLGGLLWSILIAAAALLGIVGAQSAGKLL